MRSKILIVIILIFLSSCTIEVQERENINTEETYEPNVGESCETDEECRTPMEFLIQSNCPFGSLCIDSKCNVVCPITFQSFNADPNENVLNCEIDEDCDCKERGDRSLDCLCIENNCVSVEAK